MPGTIGIDIGGGSVKIATAQTTSTSDPYRDPDASTVRRAIEQALDRAGVETMSTVGLCLPGIVEDGRVRAAANLPRLTNIKVSSLVPAATRVQVETDVRAAAHHVWHERRMAGRLLGLAIGTGVGACVLDDGAPLHVTGRSSGHVGHLDIGGAPLESLIGASALRQAAIDIDAEVLVLGQAQLQALASAMRSMHAIYRPHHVALLGGIGMRLDTTALRTAIGTPPMARDTWTLTSGWTGFHGALGAAMLAQEAPSKSAGS